MPTLVRTVGPESTPTDIAKIVKEDGCVVIENLASPDPWIRSWPRWSRIEKPREAETPSFSGMPRDVPARSLPVLRRPRSCHQPYDSEHA